MKKISITPNTETLGKVTVTASLCQQSFEPGNRVNFGNEDHLPWRPDHSYDIYLNKTWNKEHWDPWGTI